MELNMKYIVDMNLEVEETMASTRADVGIRPYEVRCFDGCAV